jgi:pimeloyl-ACP methyl ester carboxylesterase
MRPKRTVREQSGSEPLLVREYGEGPPLLLIHGLCGSQGWWRHNLVALAERFTVCIVELRGYGGNRAFLPARLDRCADAIARYIAQLPGAKAHVLGHSMGGQIAVHLAARHPECIDRLVLVSASGLLRESLARMVFRLPFEALGLTPSFAPTLALDALRSGPVNLLMSTLQILADDISTLAEAITAPTLLVWGANDRLVPPLLGEALQAKIPGSHLIVLANAGHVVLWDQPAAFNQRVLTFLSDASVAASD